MKRNSKPTNLMELLESGQSPACSASTPLGYAKKPCANCPWRTDAVPREFSTPAFRRLADTAYDLGISYFQCHKSTDENPIVCAGFLLRGAAHNFMVRMAISSGRIDMRKVSAAGMNLYPSYRAMAIANGVDPKDPILLPCRDN